MLVSMDELESTGSSNCCFPLKEYLLSARADSATKTEKSVADQLMLEKGACKKQKTAKPPNEQTHHI